MWSLAVLLLIERGVDVPLLHLRPHAVPPGLVRQQVQADVGISAVLIARDQVSSPNRV